jgi:hypothetical protein
MKLNFFTFNLASILPGKRLRKAPGRLDSENGKDIRANAAHGGDARPPSEPQLEAPGERRVGRVTPGGQREAALVGSLRRVSQLRQRARGSYAIAFAFADGGEFLSPAELEKGGRLHNQNPSFSPPRNVLPGPSGPYSLRTFQNASVG